MVRRLRSSQVLGNCRAADASSLCPGDSNNLRSPRSRQTNPSKKAATYAWRTCNCKLISAQVAPWTTDYVLTGRHVNRKPYRVFSHVDSDPESAKKTLRFRVSGPWV